MSTHDHSETPKGACDWVWHEYGRDTHVCRKKATVEVIFEAGVVIKGERRTLRCWDHYLELEEEARKSTTLRVVSARRRW